MKPKPSQLPVLPDSAFDMKWKYWKYNYNFRQNTITISHQAKTIHKGLAQSKSKNLLLLARSDTNTPLETGNILFTSNKTKQTNPLRLSPLTTLPSQRHGRTTGGKQTYGTVHTPGCKSCSVPSVPRIGRVPCYSAFKISGPTACWPSSRIERIGFLVYSCSVE